MNKIAFFFIISFFLCSQKSYCQEGFRFKNTNIKRQRISFKLINSLIVIPVTINGKRLSFILDSGVSKTIVFNIARADNTDLNNIQKLTLRGLGNGKPLQALVSKNNTITVNNLISTNENLFVVLEDKFDLSLRMGITIHGILGYNLLRNHIVKINYRTKKIDFFNPEKFKYRRCKKCEVFPIRFYRRKPYIKAQVRLDTISNTLTDVNLLIDSGGSDAFWLFEGTHKNIKTPKRFFKDILGEGLSGSIMGNRSRIPKIKLKSFEIYNPTVSFLEKASTKNARKFTARNGSLGGGVLNRFTVWFDYPNKKITIRKNSNFSKEFNYNMSGLDVIYNGVQLVKEKQKNKKNIENRTTEDYKSSVHYITNYSYSFKPSYKVKTVLKGSPGEKAGLKAGDVFVKLNNEFTYKYTLSQIINEFQEKENKKIKIEVKRNGTKMKFIFRLKKRI